MTGLDLRPLSLGEILDRTFSLYRGHFVLFIGLVGVPQVLVLAFQLAQLSLQQNSAGRFILTDPTELAFDLVLLVVSTVAYLFSQGGTIVAVSEIYLGRRVAIAEALRRVWDNLGFLFGVVVLNGLAIAGGALLLVIPGIYVACRLLVCVPVALIEERGPRDSLTRSWELTRDFAGRAFMIFLLFIALAIAAGLLLGIPAGIGMAAARAAPSSSSVLLWLVVTQVVTRIASILTQPILLIATSIFYYDLRVRKEAFDLQFMMDPNAPPPAGTGSVPSIL